MRVINSIGIPDKVIQQQFENSISNYGPYDLVLFSNGKLGWKSSIQEAYPTFEIKDINVSKTDILYRYALILTKPICKLII